MYSMSGWCDGRIECGKGQIAYGCDRSENYRNLRCVYDPDADDSYGGKIRRTRRKSRKNKKSRRR